MDLKTERYSLPSDNKLLPVLETELKLAPRSDAAQDRLGENEHFVQFYETDEFLLRSVKDYISGGDSAIVVATKEHRKTLEKGLKLYGVNVETARRKGQYVSLDARETLAKFMADSMPHPGRYFEVIGGLVKKVSTGRSKLRIFGEMVAILWAEGNHAGAIALEELWNDLQKMHKFSLFCAYPMKGFDGNTLMEPFTHICDSHSTVLPAEGYSSLNTHNDRLREIAFLQQQARSLEAEINNRKDIEEELRQSEIRYRRLFEAAADGVLIVDFKTRKILDANMFMENLLGCDREQLLGKTLCDTGLQKDDHTCIAVFKKLQKDTINKYEMLLNISGSEKHIELILNLYTENNDPVVQCNIRDITERKILEQQKDDFISAASHELKTPLTSQKAFIQLLHRSIKKNGANEYERYVNKIADQTEKLTRLVKDLLDGSKIQGGRLVLQTSSFDINICLEQLMEEVQQTSQKHSFIIKGKAKKEITGDKERISQVITNLLENAVKYSPDSREIFIHLKQNDKETVVCVEDLGIGIADKDQEHVFERFYRGSDIDENTYPGLGMGLFLSSEIACLHGGRLWMKSTKGKGSQFYFAIPLKTPVQNEDPTC